MRGELIANSANACKLNSHFNSIWKAIFHLRGYFLVHMQYNVPEDYKTDEFGNMSFHSRSCIATKKSYNKREKGNNKLTL